MTPIRHFETGTGGAPFVFVHGFACAHADWDAQAACFAPKHRVVTVDLRGHGDSPGTAASCSVERYGADVAEVMRALSLPPAIVVGHSMGCRVAVEAALQAPDRTKAVILVDGSQFAGSAVAANTTRFASPGGYEASAAALFKDMFTAKSDPAVAAAVLARALRLPKDVGEKMLTDMPRYDTLRLEASLGCLLVPVMALQTTSRDSNGQRASLRRGQTTPYLEMLRARVPGVRIDIVEDAGHFPQLDEPAQTNAAIASFVAGLAD